MGARLVLQEHYLGLDIDVHHAIYHPHLTSPILQICFVREILPVERGIIFQICQRKPLKNPKSEKRINLKRCQTSMVTLRPLERTHRGYRICFTFQIVLMGFVRGLGLQKYGAPITFGANICIATPIYCVLIFVAKLGVIGKTVF